jgi:hypothetical protein
MSKSTGGAVKTSTDGDALGKAAEEIERLKSALRQIVLISRADSGLSFEQRTYRMRAEAKLTLNEWQSVTMLTPEEANP